jgi:hypothetical protein
VRFVRSDLGVSLLEDHGAVVHLTIETHEGALASRSGSNLALAVVATIR